MDTQEGNISSAQRRTDARRGGAGSVARLGGGGLAVLLLASACNAQAQGWLDDTYVAPMLSYALADDDRRADDAFGATLALGWRMSERMEVELRGMFMEFDGKGEHPCGLLNLSSCANPSSEVKGAGIGSNLFIAEHGGPYLHLDVMVTESSSYHAGIGWSLPMGRWALRAEALAQVDDDFEYKEPLFNLGLRIPLGPHRELKLPEPVPEPVRVVEPVPPPPPPPPLPCAIPSDGSAVDFSGCKTGDTVVLRGVNFEFDKANLTVNAKVLLDMVVEALQKRPDISIEIHGHTDSKGSDAYNQKLSERRAESVQAYLVEHGVDAQRITAVQGFGETMPVADNASDEGRELNRRVELKVIAAEAAAEVPAALESPAAAPQDGAAEPPAATPLGAASSPEAMSEASLVPAASVESASAPAVAVSVPEVAIVDMAFTPATLTVAAGTTVVFTNRDGSNHIIGFADGQASPRLRMGASYQRSFNVPGTYAYACRIHPHMTGTVIVQ